MIYHPETSFSQIESRNLYAMPGLTNWKCASNWCWCDDSKNITPRYAYIPIPFQEWAKIPKTYFPKLYFPRDKFYRKFFQSTLLSNRQFFDWIFLWFSNLVFMPSNQKFSFSRDAQFGMLGRFSKYDSPKTFFRRPKFQKIIPLPRYYWPWKKIYK